MDKYKLRLAAAVASIALVFGLAIGALAAAPHATSPKPAQRNVYDALLVCPGLAEDSAAHVALTQYKPDAYSDGETLIVYRCLRNGY